MSNQEEKRAFGDEFYKVAEELDSRWMAAVWQVKDGKIGLVKLSANEFPTGDMTAALGHLGLKMHEVVLDANAPKPKPLPEVFIPSSHTTEVKEPALYRPWMPDAELPEPEEFSDVQSPVDDNNDEGMSTSSPLTYETPELQKKAEEEKFE